MTAGDDVGRDGGVRVADVRARVDVVDGGGEVELFRGFRHDDMASLAGVWRGPLGVEEFFGWSCRCGDSCSGQRGYQRVKRSFDAVEVFFGVNADGVEVGGFDVDGDAVFEEAELLEALGVFEEAVWQGGEALECGFAVGVEADVLPIWRGLAVAIVWDGGAGEVEGAAVGCGDDL